jgi:3-oxoacyl-[acyl-carrier-protein] synthase-3
MTETVSSLPRVCITGTGRYLPERVLTNAELEKMVDTTDEWIVTRTGIRQRHIARDDQAASDLAAESARKALAKAGVSAEEVDLILVGTITPDMGFPNTACFVQRAIGARRAFCLDVEAACSGFLYALEVARQFIRAGTVRTALVIGAEKLSCVTDWQDRATCVLFGDGAGAVVLQAGGTGRGILSTVMGSDGSLGELLCLPGGGSRYPASEQTLRDRLHFMKMEGREVFKHAVRCMCDASTKAVAAAGLTLADVTCIIPHQANMRIIEAIASRLGLSLDRFCLNLDRVGNMSAASVPVALDEALESGRLKHGDVVVFTVFGGGFTWGAMVVEL